MNLTIICPILANQNREHSMTKTFAKIQILCQIKLRSCLHFVAYADTVFKV